MNAKGFDNTCENRIKEGTARSLPKRRDDQYPASGYVDYTFIVNRVLQPRYNEGSQVPLTAREFSHCWLLALSS